MIKRSNVSEEDVIGSFVPIILLTIVVGSRTRSHLLLFSEARLLALEHTVILQHLQLPFLSVFFLDLLDDVIIFVVIFNLCWLFEPRLPYAEAWFLDDQVRIFLFFFDDFCCDIVVDQVIGADRRSDSFFIDYLSFDF